jgi:hypothetical protein
MTREELADELDRNGVRSDAVDLTGDALREAYSLEPAPDGMGWITFYRERGLHRDERRFDSESEACQHLLDEVLRDPTTRR